MRHWTSSIFSRLVSRNRLYRRSKPQFLHISDWAKYWLMAVSSMVSRRDLLYILSAPDAALVVTEPEVATYGIGCVDPGSARDNGVRNLDGFAQAQKHSLPQSL